MNTVRMDKTAGQLIGQGRDPVAVILDDAWQALLTARRRGPYSLCPHHAVAKN